MSLGLASLQPGLGVIGANGAAVVANGAAVVAKGKIGAKGVIGVVVGVASKGAPVPVVTKGAPVPVVVVTGATTVVVVVDPVVAVVVSKLRKAPINRFFLFSLIPNCNTAFKSSVSTSLIKESSGNAGVGVLLK
jgi:hypothetical protein